MDRRRAMWKWSALALAGTMAVAGPAMLRHTESTQPAAALGAPALAAMVEPVTVDATPTNSEQLESEVATRESSVKLTKQQRAGLEAELDKWITRDPGMLVETIAELAAAQPLPVAPTYLLSIAWAETRGKILAVSPAGAAGLAQATPAAYLSEGFDGKLFVTNQYLIGTRSYIMKKPLGDAMTISDRLVKRNTPANRAVATELLAAALDLRQEGMDELEALRPVANGVFFAQIAAADARNLEVLNDLAAIIERGAPAAETKRFNDRVRRDYKQMMKVQQGSWATYGKALEARRDALLRARFGQDAATVIRTRPYEAGEYLGEVLDARFSPRKMAEFLAAHIATKQRQALALGTPAESLDAWTAALYNGGAVNIKRMRAGLIGTLRETQKYMTLVPSKSALLEDAMG